MSNSEINCLKMLPGPAQPLTAQPRSIDIKADTTAVATLKVSFYCFHLISCLMYTSGCGPII